LKQPIAPPGVAFSERRPGGRSDALRNPAPIGPSSRPFVADFVAKVGCCRQAAVNSLSAAGFDPPALTPFTQLQRYAMHRA